MKKGLWVLLILALAGCKALYPPGMFAVSKFDVSRDLVRESQTAFQPGEGPVICIVGCSGKTVTLDVFNLDGNREVMHVTEKLAVEKVKTVQSFKRVNTQINPYFEQTEMQRGTTNFVPTAGYLLDLKKPGTFEARLTADGEFIQKLVFTVETNSVQ